MFVCYNGSNIGLGQALAVGWGLRFARAAPPLGIFPPDGLVPGLHTLTRFAALTDLSPSRRGEPQSFALNTMTLRSPSLARRAMKKAT